MVVMSMKASNKMFTFKASCSVVQGTSGPRVIAVWSFNEHVSNHRKSALSPYIYIV